MNTPRLLPQRAARATLVWLVCAAVLSCPAAAGGSSVRGDPDLEAYRALDRSLLQEPASDWIEPSPATPSRGADAPAAPVPKTAGPRAGSGETFDLPSIPPEARSAETRSAPAFLPPAAPLSETVEGRQDPVPAFPTPVPTHRVVRLVEQIPACAVMDLESDTLTPEETAAFTQIVWNEVQRSGRTRLAELFTTRHILATHDLTPSDPYRLPPSPHRLAAALRADYLVMGNVNRFGKTYAAEILLYSASSNSVVRSRTGQSDAGFDGLLRQIPAMASETMKAIPLRVLVPTPYSPPEQAPSAAGGPQASARRHAQPSQWQALESEIEQLRMDNDRQHKEIRELRALLAKSGVVPPETPAEPAAPSPAPLRRANKSAKPMKTYLRPPAAAPSPKPEPAPPESPKPAPESVREPAVQTPPVLPPEAPLSSASVPEAAVEAPVAPRPMPSLAPIAESEAAVEPIPAPAEPSATQVPGSPGTDPVEAERFFREAEKHPDSSKEGIAPLEQAIRLDPGNPRYQMDLVMRLYYTRQYPQCVERGEEFLARDGADPNLGHFVAAAHYDLGNYREALKTIDGILSRRPRDKDALYNRALNLGKLGDPGAIDAYRRYLEAARAQHDPRHAEHIQAAEEALLALEKHETKRP